MNVAQLALETVYQKRHKNLLAQRPKLFGVHMLASLHERHFDSYAREHL
jgi:hypothetical protein